MNIEEAMAEMQMNGELTLARFGGNIKLLERFIKKFPNDTTYLNLKEKAEQNEFAEVEKLAHTLKGIAANLGFDKLSKYNADIVSVIRNGQTEDVAELILKVTEEYIRLIDCINKLDS